MRWWETNIMAIYQETGKLSRWMGPDVPGKTKSDAEKYCKENGLGYCKVTGVISQDPSGIYWKHTKSKTG